MRVYRNTQSTAPPKEFEINPYKVFICKNITYHERKEDEEMPVPAYYEYDMYEYTPTEYIEILKTEKEDLKQELLDTQMALCDIYEAM